jgi:type II restriction/modification system DNA methylase subunit YeeA
MTIYEAWSDEPWVLDGAAVRVSLVCFQKGPSDASLDGVRVAAIHSDLTAGQSDLTHAERLGQNEDIAFMGVTPAGKFDVPGELAREWLQAPINPNGRPNSDVLRPYANAMDLTRRSRDAWTIDFGNEISEAAASFYALPFAYTMQQVLPERQNNARESYRRLWWRYAEPRPAMRKAISGLTRYIATPMVSKHRVFMWRSTEEISANLLNVIARDDHTTFGVLHSKFHELWALALGTWLGVGNDPRYTPSTTFETFPFPEGLTPNIPATTYATDPRAIKIATAAQNLVAARDRWLNPPELVDIVPEIVEGFPDRILPKNEKAAAILKTRTLTNLYNTRATPAGAWLNNLHRALDEAVAAAYGWPADLPNPEILARLLALNHARAALNT